MKAFHHLLNVLFPHYCLVCFKPLHANLHICSTCNYKMPRTKFHAMRHNPLLESLWGRTNISQATALYYINRKSPYLELIYQLKYNNNPSLGIELGKLLGDELKQSDFAKADLIAPVPLYKTREKKRGYNQSALICLGIKELLNIPVDEHLLKRVWHTNSQTQKSRFERAMNLEDAIQINSTRNLNNTHILLIDDIITTGATIEACCQALQTFDNVTVSVAALGFTTQQ